MRAACISASSEKGHVAKLSQQKHGLALRLLRNLLSMCVDLLVKTCNRRWCSCWCLPSNSARLLRKQRASATVPGKHSAVGQGIDQVICSMRSCFPWLPACHLQRHVLYFQPVSQHAQGARAVVQLLHPHPGGVTAHMGFAIIAYTDTESVHRSRVRIQRQPIRLAACR
jgi:hypothetical protein